MGLYKTGIYVHEKKNPDGTVAITYDPSIQFDISLDENEEPMLKVVDADRNEYSWKDIRPWSPMLLVVEKNAVWKVQTRFGVTPKVTHVLLLNPPTPEDQNQSNNLSFNFQVNEITTALTNAKRKSQGFDEKENEVNKVQKTEALLDANCKSPDFIERN